MTPEQKAERIIELYRSFGSEDYIGEPVSQIEHMCQCAQMAEQSGFDEEMILAAFFHDIGHLYEHISPAGAGHMDEFGIIDHETLGAGFLREYGFSERIVSLVQSHVQAKRYLVARFPEYRARLSEASLKTLQMQGGEMNEGEIAIFEADPLHREYIQLRYWDEQAKRMNIPLPDLEHYREMMINHLKK